MNKLKLAIIFGGKSSEYSISLKSASSVIKNINNLKYELILIGITRKGNSYLYKGDINNIEVDKWFNHKDCEEVIISNNPHHKGIYNLSTKEILKIDLALPILHGMNGEDGRLQGLLELADIPYIGCKLLSSALCMDKHLAHQLCKINSIKVPKSYCFKKNIEEETLIKYAHILKYPIYVKPLRAGSSLGISKVYNDEELINAVNKALDYDDYITIEENILGFEVGCGIIGNNELLVGEVDEIKINGFFDYDKKYASSSVNSVIPANLDKEERERIKKEAIKIYRALQCQDYARIDMFYTPNKEIIFNEVNTIPGFTTHSRFPMMFKAIGLTYEEILEKLIKVGLND